MARRLGAGAADDITAETFLTAFRIRSRYDTTRPSARPWLYGIAGNLGGLRALARTGHDPVAETWSEHADDRVAAQLAQASRSRRRDRRPSRGHRARRAVDLREVRRQERDG
ncbi:RNA polymerase ECF-subfamily sigma factor [Streptomyces sp. NL15-2K]|nr:RNA polymerase ECF-subfamily sigma factor [Streptomyces sp. NL15-2K]